jgi:hypothetical protein
VACKESHPFASTSNAFCNANSVFTILLVELQLQLCHDRQSASQSMLVSGTHVRPSTIFSYLDSCGFVDVGRPLWREDGSVVDSCCWAFPAQFFSGSESRGTHDHILMSQIWGYWNTEDQILVFISGRWGPRYIASAWTQPNPTKPNPTHCSQRLSGVQRVSLVIQNNTTLFRTNPRSEP